MTKVEIKGAKRIITIEEVSQEATPSPLILLLECPEGFTGEELNSNEVLQYLLQNEMENENLGKTYYVSDIVHFADFDTVSTPLYQKWVSAF